MTKKRNYWLLKSESESYSISDFEKEKITGWTGVRNYQARNFMRDNMRVGDKILFYHSVTKIPGIAGVGEVVRESYPDPTQFNKKSVYFDPKATKEKPRWFIVDIKFMEKLKNFVSLEYLKSKKVFDGMEVTKIGSRLSVQPVNKKHFDAIIKTGSKSV